MADEIYYPTGPNNKANAYYEKQNHTRLAKMDSNKTEFFGTVGGDAGSEFTVTITGLDSGFARIDDPILAVVNDYPGADPVGETYAWLHGDMEVGSAAAFIPSAGLDGDSIRCLISTSEYGNAYSSLVQVRYHAPVAGVIGDVSYSENTGDQTVDGGAAFTGDDITYSVATAVAGVTIDSGTGVVTIPTDQGTVSGEAITVTGTNSGGSDSAAFLCDINAAAGVVVLSYKSASVTVDGAVSSGTYLMGEPWANVGGVEATITATTPAFAAGQAGTTSEGVDYSGRSINGMMLNPGNAVDDTATYGSPQGYDGPDGGGNPSDLIPGHEYINLAYNTGLNVDPVFLGAAFPISGGTLVKQIANMTPLNILTNATTNLVPFTIVPSSPPANAFRPGVASADVTSKWTEDDIDYTVLSNLAPTASSITWATAAANLDGLFQNQYMDALQASNIAPSSFHYWYGREICIQLGNSMVKVHETGSNAEKRDTVIGIIQAGIDMFSRLEEGTSWFGAGGGNHWHKACMVMTAELLNDNALRAVCADLTFAQVDLQGFTVRQMEMLRVPETGDDATRLPYDYHMFDMAEWGEQHATQPERDSSLWGANYRRTVCNSAIGSILAVRLLPGGITTWGSQAVFDYYDRVYWNEAEYTATDPMTTWYKEVYPAWRNYTDSTAPVLEVAAVSDDATAVYIRFDEHLREWYESGVGNRTPDAADFVLTDDGGAQTVTSVDVRGLGVKLTVGAALVGNVTLDYTPGTTPLWDFAGNTVQAIAGRLCDDPLMPPLTADDLNATAVYVADDLANLFQAADGSVPVTGDGQTVRWWGNSAGDVVPLRQEGATPVEYNTDGTHHWLTANATDESLTSDTSLQMFSDSDEGVIVEVEQISAGSDPRMVRGSPESVGAGVQLYFAAAFRPRVQVNTVQDGFQNTETSLVLTAGVPAGVAGLWREEDGVLFYFVNNVARSNKPVGAGRDLVSSVGQTVMGGTGPNLKMYGAVFTRDISSANLALIDLYLGTKSGRYT